MFEQKLFLIDQISARSSNTVQLELKTLYHVGWGASANDGETSAAVLVSRQPGIWR